MTTDIIEELDGLIKQAETENSHFYVSRVCKKAIAEILMLRSRPTYDAYHAVCQAYWKRVEEAKEKDVTAEMLECSKSDVQLRE